MKKILSLMLIIGIFLMISFVLAENSVEEDLDEFVKKIAEKKGINKKEITNVEEVNFSNLPKEVNIENIDDSNIALYKLDSNDGKTSFVITFSDEAFKKIIKTPSSFSTALFHFGLSGKQDKSIFMETATGVLSSSNQGYVMMRSGSITGISTNFAALKDEGRVQIIIYKNGEEIGFGNSIEVLSSGVKKDFDIQSTDIVTFEPGDLISVYVKIDGKISIENIITVLETTIKN